MDGYELVEEPDNADGEFTEEPQTVTYVYAPVEDEGLVTVEHVDEDGNELAPSEDLTGDIGDTYNSPPEVMVGYELVEEPDNADGEFTEDPQTVTYVYAPVDDEGDAAPVTVEHVDENGDPIADPEELTGNVGDPYESQPEDIDGYELVEEPDNADGEFTEEPQTVTYVYAPVDDEGDAAPVTVEHVDEDGDPIADPEELTGDIGEPYESQPEDIDGYELVEEPDNVDGEFTEEPQTVTYVYAPVEDEGDAAPITVEYVDEDGDPIADPEELTGDIGEPYESQPEDIDGYELVEEPENADGEFTEEPQTVTYVYAPVENEGLVTVEHVDEDDNELAPSEDLTSDIDDPYETQPEDIDGYELVEEPENADGEFTEEPQTVTYVYAPVDDEGDAAPVTDEHVDEDGEPIADPEELTGDIGERYESQPEDIDGYELVEEPDNADGEFTEEPQTVTYVYAPVEDEGDAAPITVEYVDEDGDPIADPEELT